MKKTNEGRTALMFAVTNIQKDSVNLSLDHGADVNATANDGGTAPMLAASSGDSDIVRALLSRSGFCNDIIRPDFLCKPFAIVLD